MTRKNYVHTIASESGHYEDVYFKKDYSEYDRVVHMRKKKVDGSYEDGILATRSRAKRS